MYAPRYKNLLNNLKDNFVLTGTEVVHIKKAYQVASHYCFKSQSSSYTEIHLKVQATSYHLDQGAIKKQEISEMTLLIDTSQIINVTNENIAHLLLADCSLVRAASTDWCKKKKAS